MSGGLNGLANWDVVNAATTAPAIGATVVSMKFGYPESPGETGGDIINDSTFANSSAAYFSVWR